MPIEPTVSRMVWYRPGPRDCAGGENPIPQIDGTAPLHSMICGVLGPGRVNLAVFGADGSGPYPRVDVALVQDGYEVQPGQCTWMPFQKGQAANLAGAADGIAAKIEQHIAAAKVEIEAHAGNIVMEIKRHFATPAASIPKLADHPAAATPIPGLVQADPSLPVVDGGAPAVAAETHTEQAPTASEPAPHG